MADKKNATCGICGKEYYACLSCKDSMQLNPWKVHTDTAEHFKVFQVVRGYSTGVYTKDEAREKFKNIDLTDIESFMPHIKKIVKDIIKEEKAVAETVKEELVVEKVTMPRKKNYKMEVE